MNIDEVYISPVGSELEGKDLFSKEYLGFDSNKIASKIVFIRAPCSDASISCDYLSNNDLENIYNKCTNPAYNRSPGFLRAERLRRFF